ncbi:xyloglucan endotransglucosylase/hydrolase protein 22-like [Durio zibethinus]|uniref:xyloglucan:xyloglucosyl transferase n=1 Tax=Durio zibethinus TaxID=66656 RepID=A0A6P5ZM32_DURZI|nr:xyloglucan endotransglucosylase/hydrolase protein 22-like [Durio zibethinus]
MVNYSVPSLSFSPFVLTEYTYFSFYVDGTPIRQLKNLNSTKVPFPKRRPMRIHSSIWNAEEWATRGGLIKIDWTKAPFTASYRNISAQACIWPSRAYPCNSNSWLAKELDAPSLERLMWVQKHYMIYNYCIDTKRFPQGLPLECAATT